MHAQVRFSIDILNQALTSISANRFRSFLSILGVTAGISAIIIISSISNSSRQVIYTELHTFGLNLVLIRREANNPDPRVKVIPGTGIKNDDLYAIKTSNCCVDVTAVSPVVKGRDLLVKRKGKFTAARILGVNEDYLHVNNDTILLGRALNLDDINYKRPVVVLGPRIVENLFGKGVNPINYDINVDGHLVTVIGVLRDKSRAFLSKIDSELDSDSKTRILIPFTFLQTIKGLNDSIDSLQLDSSEPSKSQAVVFQVTSILKHRNNNQFNYKAETMEERIATVDKILDILSLVGIIGASVSLIVGGLGILNIMSTSVIERTKEIGIRKASGASNSDILLQFLYEAIIISFLGGICGIILGLTLSFLLSKITALPFAIQWNILIIGVIASIIVGLFSGITPALNAAKMKPVNALQNV